MVMIQDNLKDGHNLFTQYMDIHGEQTEQLFYRCQKSLQWYGACTSLDCNKLKRAELDMLKDRLTEQRCTTLKETLCKDREILSVMNSMKINMTRQLSIIRLARHKADLTNKKLQDVSLAC